VSVEQTPGQFRGRSRVVAGNKFPYTLVVTDEFNAIIRPAQEAADQIVSGVTHVQYFTMRLTLRVLARVDTLKPDRLTCPVV